MVWLFQIPLWAAVIAVPMAVVMGFVAARVTGETDITPTKALGPVTQLVYGALTPGNLSGNIMAANVTGGIGLHAADLLTTLKTGWLLGGGPRAQFRAHLFGVLAGAAVVVPAFNLLIPDPSLLGGDAWPAPSCLVWAGVSQAFAGGLGALDPAARSGILSGLLLGVALALLERFAPRALKHLIPSASGLGIALAVKDVMTAGMYTVTLNTSIEQCMALMETYHIRHLPVVENEQLVGMVSIRDVMVAALENRESEIKGLENYILASGFAGSTLAISLFEAS